MEYDFVPNDLAIDEGDLVHIQWTGEYPLITPLFFFFFFDNKKKKVIRKKKKKEKERV